MGFECGQGRLLSGVTCAEQRRHVLCSTRWRGSHADVGHGASVPSADSVVPPAASRLTTPVLPRANHRYSRLAPWTPPESTLLARTSPGGRVRPIAALYVDSRADDPRTCAPVSRSLRHIKSLVAVGERWIWEIRERAPPPSPAFLEPLVGAVCDLAPIAIMSAGDSNGRPVVPRRRYSYSIPMLTDAWGNSLNDRLLFAVPKSKLRALRVGD